VAHPAWGEPEAPKWATLAPGVRFLMKPVTGATQAMVNARVARCIGALQEGRAVLEDIGFDAAEMGVIGDLEQLAGLSIYLAGVFTADVVVEAWEGLDDAAGVPIPRSPEAIRAALMHGPPEGGNALLEPFMAWLDRPRIPIAAECRRLRELAKWEHGGGLKHCEGCDLVAAECSRGGTDAGARCPRAANAPQTEPGIAALAVTRHAGVWRRAGMGGALVGLDMTACLALASKNAHDAASFLDEGAFIRCLAALETGALEAAAEAAEREGK
jgi:hypothetical protein